MGELARWVESPERSTEATDRIEGRVLEALPPAADGGRAFRVQLIAYGDSKNRRRYPESVLRGAVARYEGARAFDHHRSDDELRTSTIRGLVGQYRDVAATATGLEATLHLLPSATHTAEALDASLAAQQAGLPPLVGVSHDVMARYSPVPGRPGWQEAIEIASVNSADVVTDPAAGGRVTRMVAGGIGDIEPLEGTVNLKQLIALLRTADPAKRVELLAEHATILDGAGVTADDLGYQANGEPLGAPEPAPAAVAAAATAPAAAAPEPEPVGATESVYRRDSLIGGQLVTAALASAGVDQRLHAAFAGSLPDRFTEAELVDRIGGGAQIARLIEAAGLEPTVTGTGTVTEDEMDRKRARLDAMFDGNFKEGYSSLRRAYIDIVGDHRLDPLDAELPFMILRESAGYRREGERSTESVTTTSWGEVFGDSITRRMLKLYNVPSLQTWRRLVDVTTVNDFRTQRRLRMGGYGVLPAVNEGAPYQPLTTPADEEATYAPTKRGGLEDLTLEAIANDDMGVVRQIPQRLARAAAHTLQRYVFDIFATNPTIYDSVALFHASHANTDVAALSQSALEAAEAAMMGQVAYGDSLEILDLQPKFLVVPTGLWHTAWKLANSAVTLSTLTGQSSDVPNPLAGRLEVIRVPYYTDTNDWFLLADPADIPTIELGFFNGREEPELFVQDDPRVGAAFNADKITYKIRHIYGGAVMDYRGFVRRTQ